MASDVENVVNRPGTVDYGRDYEMKMAALLSLRCMVNKNILDLWMAMNVDECGAFDDIVLHVETRTAKKITFLIQLKYMHKPKNVAARDFKVEGDFQLKKYYDSVVQIDKYIRMEGTAKSTIMEHLMHHRESIVFIIFTTRGVSENMFLKKVDRKCDYSDQWLLHQLVDTNGEVFLFDCNQIEFLRVEDQVKDLLERFLLFAKQVNISQLDVAIETALANLLGPINPQKKIISDLREKYVSFITNWSKGDLGGYFKMTKTLIMKVLLEQLITPYIENPKITEGQASHSKLWSEITKQHSLLVVEIDEQVVDFLNKVIGAAIKEYCNNTTNKNLWKRHPEVINQQILRMATRSKEVKFDEAYEFLWKTGEVPLLLILSDIEEFNYFYQIWKKLSTAIKIILLVKFDVDALTSYEGLCRSLNDFSLNVVEEILELPVQLQGRCFVKLSDVLDTSVKNFISIRHLIYILGNEFSIGSKIMPPSEIFIERALQLVSLRPDVLREVDDIFVIRCKFFSEIKVFLSKHLLNLNSSEICQYENVNDAQDLDKYRIIVADKEFPSDIFIKKSAHFLVLENCSKIRWSKSIGTIKNILNFSTAGDFDGCSVDLSEVYQQNVALISASPGMGKSVLLDKIALNTSTDLWVIKVNLHEHVSYYKNDDFEEFHSQPSHHLRYFAERSMFDGNCSDDLVKGVFEKYLADKKVLVLLDGFDEIPLSCRREVSDMVKSLQDHNYRIIITTRQISKKYLEELLDTFAIGINPFTRTNQVEYLTRYFSVTLEDKYAKNENKLVEYVKKLLDAAKRNLNDDDQNFTGIPLQTKLLADVFLSDCKFFIDTDDFRSTHFDLLYLYERFVKRKIDMVCFKFGSASDDIFHQYKAYRSFFALQLLFSEQDLKELDVEGKLNQLVQLFPDALQHIQKDGIVVVQSQSSVSFVHRTYAEYLAADWLSSSINSEFKSAAQNLVQRIFEPNYVTIRNIFDRMLAKRCPLHLAVITRQVDNVKGMILSDRSALVKTDKGGRTVVHLMAAWGAHHPFHAIPEKELGYLYEKVTKDPMVEIFKLVCTEKITSSKENVLSATQVDYAILSGSLNIADMICSKLADGNRCISLREVNINQYFYFKYFSYGSLSSALIKYSTMKELEAALEQTQLITSEDVLHYEIMRKNIQKVSLLLSLHGDINKINLWGFTPLHVAVMSGDTLMVNLLVSNGADLNLADATGKTPLHWAVIKGQNDIVNLLLFSDNINPDVVDNNGMSALHYVILTTTENQKDIITVLSKSGMNMITKDNYDKTPLHYALHYNQIENLRLLLSCGTDIKIENKESALASNEDYLSLVLSSKDSDGGTVLHWAADKGLTDIVELFLSYGANPEFEDNDGKTALHWAAEKGHDKVISLLLSYGINVDVKDWSGRTPLSLAINSASVEAAKLLLANGANIYEKDNIGRSPLLQAIVKNLEEILLFIFVNQENISIEEKDFENMSALNWAAWNGNTKAVELLLTKNPSLEEKNVDGRTPLISASLSGHTDVVRLLLKEGAVVEANDKEKLTALHWASWNNHLDTAIVLISEGGANIEARDTYKRTPLICAAHNGHESIVNMLLRSGANIEMKNNQGMTALNWAAYKDHGEVVKMMISKKADINTKSDLGRTPLANAADQGHVDIVAELILNEADLEVQDIEGMNPLHCAASKGHTSVINILLVNGAGIEAKSKYEKTALIYAADFGHLQALELLLERGAFIEARDVENMNALIWASHNGRTELVKLLLAKGAATEIRNRHGRTALICAAQNGHTESVYALMCNGADVEVTDNEGMAAVHWAAYNGFLEIVSLLLMKGMSMESVDLDKRTILMHATYNGHENVINFLLRKGASVDQLDELNMTALHWAAWHGHDGVVEILHSRGARLEVKDQYGRTPLTCAVQNNKKSTLELLCRYGADAKVTDINNRSLLHCAVGIGSVDLIEFLLNLELDLNVRDDSGKTALFYAAIKGNVDAAALLLSKGSDMKIKDSEGTTILLLVVQAGHIELTKLLLLFGADLEASNGYGYTPLICAAMNGYTDIAGLLISAGSNIEAEDNKSMRALHWSVSKGHGDITNLLIEAGVDLDSKDISGRTVLIYAVHKNDITTADLLLSKGSNINVCDNMNIAPIHWALRIGTNDMVSLFLSRGADVNVKDNKGRTPLMDAVRKSKHIIVSILQKGANGNAADIRGQTALHCAVRSKCKEAAELLLDWGANVNVKDKLGQTALMIASSKGDLEMVSLLVVRGAEVDVKDESGLTAYDKAGFRGHEDVLLFLNEHKDSLLQK